MIKFKEFKSLLMSYKYFVRFIDIGGIVVYYRFARFIYGHLYDLVIEGVLHFRQNITEGRSTNHTPTDVLFCRQIL